MVIEQADYGATRNSYPAQITGIDPYSDLAVLQASAALKKEQMKPIPIRNSSAPQIGENVGSTPPLASVGMREQEAKEQRVLVTRRHKSSVFFIKRYGVAA